MHIKFSDRHAYGILRVECMGQAFFTDVKWSVWALYFCFISFVWWNIKGFFQFIVSFSSSSPSRHSPHTNCPILHCKATTQSFWQSDTE